ncbi:hypothetical protein L228DRAFT_178439 [Xylona heveae TC161]|uniref:Uncharacterized protein n=1 Tax=Xylona heveae (strain CBS 132557 / TC161) TaxID=1328760 RepID=A0A165F9U6_XYLHT|nr:hypothetical protein L228DRAFT_178439 [Xylona heveae TC161]KZF20747.1 hypothetical protein L228DRAFT_178439 [Xylona heveae TC161]
MLLYQDTSEFRSSSITSCQSTLAPHVNLARMPASGSSWNRATCYSATICTLSFSFKVQPHPLLYNTTLSLSSSFLQPYRVYFRMTHPSRITRNFILPMLHFFSTVRLFFFSPLCWSMFLICSSLQFFADSATLRIPHYFFFKSM